MELTTHEKIDAAREALEGGHKKDALALTLEALSETLEVAQAAATRAGVPQDVELP